MDLSYRSKPSEKLSEILPTPQKSGFRSLRTRFSLRMSHATLTTRLVDAEYPKYEKVFPESSEMRTVVQKEPMLHAIQRISPFLDTKCPAVCLEIDEQQIRMSPRDSDPDEKHETLAVESSTGSIRIGFDTRLLIETLTRMETESLVMAFAGELEPMTVTPLGAEGHICLIMPMSLDWR